MPAIHSLKEAAFSSRLPGLRDEQRTDWQCLSSSSKGSTAAFIIFLLFSCAGGSFAVSRRSTLAWGSPTSTVHPGCGSPRALAFTSPSSHFSAISPSINPLSTAGASVYHGKPSSAANGAQTLDFYIGQSTQSSGGSGHGFRLQVASKGTEASLFGGREVTHGSSSSFPSSSEMPTPVLPRALHPFNGKREQLLNAMQAAKERTESRGLIQRLWGRLTDDPLTADATAMAEMAKKVHQWNVQNERTPGKTKLIIAMRHAESKFNVWRRESFTKFRLRGEQIVTEPTSEIS